MSNPNNHPLAEDILRLAQRTHRDWFGTEEFPFPKAGGRRE